MIINPVNPKKAKDITEVSFEKRLNSVINMINNDILSVANKGMNRVTVFNDLHMLKTIRRIYKKAGFKTCLDKDPYSYTMKILEIIW